MCETLPLADKALPRPSACVAVYAPSRCHGQAMGPAKKRPLLRASGVGCSVRARGAQTANQVNPNPRLRRFVDPEESPKTWGKPEVLQGLFGVANGCRSIPARLGNSHWATIVEMAGGVT